MRSFSSYEPADPVVKRYVGHGEEDAGQHVRHAQALLTEPEQIYREAEQQHAAHAGHLGDDRGAEVRRERGGQQREHALADEDADGGGDGPGAQPGPEGQRGYEVEHGLGVEDGVVAVYAGLDAAHDGHGADAEEYGAGDEGLGEAALGLGELPLGQRAEGLYPVVDAQQLTNERADGGAEDETERVGRADDADDAEAEADQRQRGHECGGVFFLYLFPKEQPDDPADQHGPGIRQHAKHKQAPKQINRMEMIQFHAKDVNSAS